jgi:hypothetical protein
MPLQVARARWIPIAILLVCPAPAAGAVEDAVGIWNLKIGWKVDRIEIRKVGPAPADALR